MTDKPIKATLDSSDDSVKTQKPILIQLDDIPTPTSEDAGKVLGVDAEGSYALTEGGGGGSTLYGHQIGFYYNTSGYVCFVNLLIISESDTPFTYTTLSAYLKAKGFTDTDPGTTSQGYPCSGYARRDDELGHNVGLASADGANLKLSVFYGTAGSGAVRTLTEAAALFFNDTVFTFS